MKKWRREVFPTNIKSIDDLATKFNDQKIKKLFESEKIKLNIKLVTDKNGAKHLLLYDEGFVQKYFFLC